MSTNSTLQMKVLLVLWSILSCRPFFVSFSSFFLLAHLSNSINPRIGDALLHGCLSAFLPVPAFSSIARLATIPVLFFLLK